MFKIHYYFTKLEDQSLKFLLQVWFPAKVWKAANVAWSCDDTIPHALLYLNFN